MIDHMSVVSSPLIQGCVRGQHGRNQGQGSSRPRPQNFVLVVEASPRGPPSL